MGKKKSSTDKEEVPVELEEITDYSAWDRFDSFSFYEAACLIAGNIPQGESVKYPDYIEEIRNHLFQIAAQRMGGNQSMLASPTLEVWIEDMEDYAAMCGIRPKFLSYRKERTVSSNVQGVDEIKSELKEIKTKLEALESENKRLTFQIRGEYMNPEHPLFSPELESAVSAWMALFANGDDVKGKGKASKALIRKWLKENRPDLSTAAIDRIEVLSNPQAYKSGGAPKTDY